MSRDQRIIIFTKNPELGKCKTRLAATIGDKAALSIYEQLLDYTISFCKKLSFPKKVYYSSEIPDLDRWSLSGFYKDKQVDGDLGDRMKAAFQNEFSDGAKSVVIIGTDCAQINETDIQEAFKSLFQHDVVIGPADDGGYYLLGMNYLIPELFENKSWSTERLIGETTATLQEKDIDFLLLQEKSDIDYEEDLAKESFVAFYW
jgi:rSAM/selenodomain-associated transferase 1